MKIAFYVANENIGNVDFRKVDEGNPGVGGSEYSAILIASQLCARGYIDCIMLCDKPGIFPSSLRWNACKDFIGAIKYSNQNKIDFLVVDGKLLTKDIVCRFNKVKFVGWANTFIKDDSKDFISRMNNVINIVNVGKEELEQTKGHPIYNKSCYIFNAVPTSVLSHYPNLTPNNLRSRNVCYIGSLHAAKGFQYLAKAWPSIIKEIPGAQLYVIGSGKLYGRNAKLGKWGIASFEFEREFIPFITEDGKILNSVHFLGIMGNEKYDILEKCKVGVPNPSGVSETFGYTAVEMQFMDCQVTTIKCAGYIDTVCDKSNLYENTDQLASYVIRLLKNNCYDKKATMDYIKQFSIENVIKEWEKLFLNIELDNLIVKDVITLEIILNTFIYYYNRLRTYIKKLVKWMLKK